MKQALIILGVLWLLPITILVWLFYILPLTLRDIEYIGQPSFMVFHFQLISKRSWYARLWRDWLGWSGPCVIIARNPDNLFTPVKASMAKIIIHETRHCYQQFVFGPLFYPAYILCSIVLWMLGKFTSRKIHAYLDNPFERDARRAANQQVNIPPEQWPQGSNDMWPWW
jgi:hypothetical protein